MRSLLLSLALTLGCTDSEGEAEAEAEAEAESEGEGEAAYTTAAILVASTDAASGAVSAIDLETLEAEPLLAPASGDATARAWNGRYYVINRFGFDSLQVHDPQSDFRIVRELSVGSTTDNAQDICCTSREQCFVPRLQDSELLVVNPETTDHLLDSIDLSGVGGVDENPNAHSCHIEGDTLLVVLQNLDDSDPWLTAMEPAWLGIIDIGTKELNTVTTPVSNPFGRFEPQGDGTAVVGLVGNWGDTDGGYAQVDLATGAPMGIVLSESALGGDVSRIAVCSTGEAFAITTICDADFNCSTPLLPVDLGTGTVGDPVYETDGFALTWAAADDRSRLWVAERSIDGDSGIWVYDCGGTPITDKPIDVGLPPAWEGVIEFL